MPLCDSKIINSFGIFLDIIGAWLVSYEIVKQYNGKKYRDDVTGDEMDEPVRETQQYKQWEINKYKYMKWGLISLTLGFAFQLISTWMK